MAYPKEEREKNKRILVATLNYLLENHSIDMVLDEYSPSKQWYLEEIKKTELDIEKSRSKQIENRLNMHISLLRGRFDLGLNPYIKLHTGYDIDIFEKFKADIMPILPKRYIDGNDVSLIENYLKAYETQPEEQENVALLKVLLAAHQAKVNRWMKLEGIITEEIHFVVQGKKSWTFNEAEYLEMQKEWLLYEEVAPNGLFKLSVQISGKGQHAITYVNITLPGGVGGIYTVKGEKLPIKVYWKDDHKVIIETKKEYEKLSMYKQVRSYDELVKIEYRFVE